MTAQCARIRHAGGARAFTLVELLVAAVMTAFIAAATATAISQAVRARAASQGRLDAQSRADTAAERIAVDVETAIRDHDLFAARVAIADGGDARGDELLLFSRSLRPVRPGSGENEGADYEVQYRLSAPGVGGPRQLAGPAGTQASLLTLWRRADPVPDQTPDGGGVAAPIVDGLTGLSIEAYDGSAWLASWDSDYDGYPHAVRITVTAANDAGKYTATARRVVALDRTPIPADTLLQTESELTGSANAPQTQGTSQ